jgi:hypothetical protein
MTIMYNRYDIWASRPRDTEFCGQEIQSFG